MPERPACRPVHARRLGQGRHLPKEFPSDHHGRGRSPDRPAAETQSNSQYRVSESDTFWRLPGGRRRHFSGNFRWMPSLKNQWQISGNSSNIVTDSEGRPRWLNISNQLIYNDLPPTRGTDKIAESAFGT